MTTFEEITTFCRKKGFMYPSSEIYGGLGGIYDYGHLGTLLKHHFENLWRSYFLSLSENFYEIESSLIMPENVFKASGHLENFIDPIVKCSKCGHIERADHLVERTTKTRVAELTPGELTLEIKKHNLVCPLCKSAFEPVTVFNMMFPVQIGVGKQVRAFLRPETAQGPYVNFKTQYELQRKKLPLGLALIGRAYRNEISPRHFTLRQREFTQAELQIFFDPDTIGEHPRFEEIKNIKIRVLLLEDRKDDTVKERTAQELTKLLPKYYIYHLVKIQEFYLEYLQIPKEKFRLYQLSDKEKAFYNKYHFDVEVELNELGFTEVGGLHYRTDHDLAGHQKISGESMEIVYEEKKLTPHVLELSFGVDRNVYALIDNNYENDTQRGNIVLHLPPKLAPMPAAVFPLVKNKPELVEKTREVYTLLKKALPLTFYDDQGSVGRRYARIDEIGIPIAVTVDFDTLSDNTVTLRDRETTTQVRVKISELVQKIHSLFAGEPFEKLGILVK